MQNVVFQFNQVSNIWNYLNLRCCTDYGETRNARFYTHDRLLVPPTFDLLANLCCSLKHNIKCGCFKGPGLNKRRHSTPRAHGSESGSRGFDSRLCIILSLLLHSFHSAQLLTGNPGRRETVINQSCNNLHPSLRKRFY